MADPEEEYGEGEEEETSEQLPELWKYTAPIGDEEKAASGPQVGKIVQFLDTKDEEGLLEELTRRNPATGESLLMWATLQQKFVLVEWLIKKGKRDAFAFSDDKKEITIYDKFAEKRKEREQEERERAEAEEAGEAPEEDEEEKEAPPSLADLVKQDLGDEEGVDDYLIKRVGELGVYQGQRDAKTQSKTGLGQTLFPNGDMYIGEYKENKRHGVGTYWWAGDGNMYIGEWRNNQRSGTGRMVYVNGARYYGNWRHDCKEGKGRFTSPNGNTYSGEWVAGVKQGQGTFTFAADNSQYIGTFSNDEFVAGEWRLSGGTRYYGVFENYTPTGIGVFVHRHGKDSSYSQDGRYEKGRWIPSRVRKTNQPNPDLGITVQGQQLQLKCTHETANMPLSSLVQVANFVPFVRWLQHIASPTVSKDFRVTDILVRAVEWGMSPRLIKSVRLKVNAVNSKGERIKHIGHPDEDSITLIGEKWLLLAMLRCGEEEAVVAVTKPLLAVGDLRAAVLPEVDVVGGQLMGDTVSKLLGIGMELNDNTVVSLTDIRGTSPALNTHEAETDTTHKVVFYLQSVTHPFWATLEDRVKKHNTPGGLSELKVMSVDELERTSPDAATLGALGLYRMLRETNRIPMSTTHPMRPPTPPPPVPEPRPAIPEPPPEEKPAPKEAEPEDDE